MRFANYTQGHQVDVPHSTTVGTITFMDAAQRLAVDLQSRSDDRVSGLLNTGQMALDASATAVSQGLGQVDDFVRRVQPLVNEWSRNITAALPSRAMALQNRVLSATQMAVHDNIVGVLESLTRPVSVDRLLSVFNTLGSNLQGHMQDVQSRSQVIVSGAHVAHAFVSELQGQIQGMDHLVAGSQNFLSRGRGLVSQLQGDVNAQLRGLTTYTSDLNGALGQVLRDASQILDPDRLLPISELDRLGARLTQGLGQVSTRLRNQVSALTNPALLSAMVLDQLTSFDTAALSRLDRALVSGLTEYQRLLDGGASQALLEGAARTIQSTVQSRTAMIDGMGAAVLQISQFSALMSNIGVVTSNTDIQRTATVIGGVAQIALGVFALFNPASALVVGLGGAAGAFGVINAGLGGIFSGFGGFGGGGSGNAMAQLLNAILPVLNQISQQINDLHEYVELRLDHTDQLIRNVGEFLGNRVTDLERQIGTIGLVLQVDLATVRRELHENQRDILDRFVDVRGDLNAIRNLVQSVADNTESILTMLNQISGQIHRMDYHRIITQYVDYYRARTYNPSSPDLDPAVVYQGFLAMIDYGTRGAVSPQVTGDPFGRYDLIAVGRIPINGTLNHVGTVFGFLQRRGHSLGRVALPRNLSVPFDVPYSPAPNDRVVNPLVWMQVVNDLKRFMANVPELGLRSGDRRYIQDMIVYGEHFLQKILALKTTPEVFTGLLNDYERALTQVLEGMHVAMLTALGIPDGDIQADMQAFQARVGERSAQALVQNTNATIRAIAQALLGHNVSFTDCQVKDYTLPVGQYYEFPWSSDAFVASVGGWTAPCYIADLPVVQAQMAGRSYQDRPSVSCYRSAGRTLGTEAIPLVNGSFDQLYNSISNCQSPEHREAVHRILSDWLHAQERLTDFERQKILILRNLHGFLNLTNTSRLQTLLSDLNASQIHPHLPSLVNAFVSRVNALTACRPETFDKGCNWPTTVNRGGPRWRWPTGSRSNLNTFISTHGITPKFYGYRHFPGSPDPGLQIAPHAIGIRTSGPGIPIAPCEILCPSHFVQYHLSFHPFTVRQAVPNRAPDESTPASFSPSFVGNKTLLNREVASFNTLWAPYEQYRQDLARMLTGLPERLRQKDILNNSAPASVFERFSNLSHWFAHDASHAERALIQSELLRQMQPGMLLRQNLDVLSSIHQALQVLLVLAFEAEYFRDFSLQRMMAQLWSGAEIERSVRQFNVSDANSSVWFLLHQGMLGQVAQVNGTLTGMPWQHVSRHLQSAMASAQQLQNQSQLSPGYAFVVEGIQDLIFVRDWLLPRGLSPLDITASVIANAYEGRPMRVNAASAVLQAIAAQGIQIDRVDSQGNSPFMLLVGRCNETAVRMLSNETGVSRNRLNRAGESALNLALACPHRVGREAMLSMLLSMGVIECLATDALELALVSLNLSAADMARIRCFLWPSTQLTTRSQLSPSPATTLMTTSPEVQDQNTVSENPEGSINTVLLATTISVSVVVALAAIIGLVVYVRSRARAGRYVVPEEGGGMRHNPAFLQVQNHRVGGVQPGPREGVRGAGVADVVVVAVALLMLNPVEAASWMPALPSGDDMSQTFEPPFESPEPDVTDDKPDALKTLYRDNLAPHAHVSQYLQHRHGYGQDSADWLMQPFNDFTGNLALFACVVHVLKDFICPDESVKSSSQAVKVVKSEDHVKSLSKLGEAIGCYESKLTRYKNRYPGADWSWAAFCLELYRDRLNDLSNQALIDPTELVELRADMKAYRKDFREHVASLGGARSVSVRARGQARVDCRYDIPNEVSILQVSGLFAFNEAQQTLVGQQSVLGLPIARVNR